MILSIRVLDADVQTQRVTLAGAAYTLRLVWRETIGAWYLDVRDSGELPIMLGRRLVADWVPTRYAADVMGGVFVVTGDPTRDALPSGEASLLFATLDELPESVTTQGDYLIVQPPTPPDNIGV